MNNPITQDVRVTSCTPNTDLHYSKLPNYMGIKLFNQLPQIINDAQKSIGSKLVYMSFFKFF